MLSELFLKIFLLYSFPENHQTAPKLEITPSHHSSKCNLNVDPQRITMFIHTLTDLGTAFYLQKFMYSSCKNVVLPVKFTCNCARIQ